MCQLRKGRRSAYLFTPLIICPTIVEDSVQDGTNIASVHGIVGVSSEVCPTICESSTYQPPFLPQNCFKPLLRRPHF